MDFLLVLAGQFETAVDRAAEAIMCAATAAPASHSFATALLRARSLAARSSRCSSAFGNIPK
jgi:hypothetical protein